MAKKSKKANKDIFQRFKEAIIDFFREEPAKKPSKPVSRKKRAVKKRKSKKTTKRRVKKTVERQRKSPPTPPKRKPEEVPMPAPWSKVTKYKKVKSNNYYF